MKPKVIVTNPDRYEETVVDVDASGLESWKPNPFGSLTFYRGTIEIEAETGRRTFTGEHAPKDYEQEFGFVLQTPAPSGLNLWGHLQK